MVHGVAWEALKKSQNLQLLAVRMDGLDVHELAVGDPYCIYEGDSLR